MPTNVPPIYYELARQFREAQDPQEKIALLEEMYSVVPKHKGTEHLLGDLRRKLSRLKEEAQRSKKAGGHQSAYYIPIEGAGQAVVIGPSNVGKSALIAALTNAEPEVSPVPFTTRKPIPGMMPIEDIQVQLIDTPPMEQHLAESALFEMVRRSNLIILVVDLLADPLQQFEDTLLLLSEHRIAPKGSEERYADRERMSYLPMIILANKCDDQSMDEIYHLFCELFEDSCPVLPISALTGRGFDELKHAIFEKLNIIRVYAKPPGKEPDLERPFVLKKGSTVGDLALKVHRDFFDKLKSARVWGSSAFDGQLVQRDYVLADKDIVELHL